MAEPQGVCVSEVWRGVLPSSSQKKFENAPKKARRHFSIFVPLTGVQMLLEASVCSVTLPK